MCPLVHQSTVYSAMVQRVSKGSLLATHTHSSQVSEEHVTETYLKEKPYAE
jgi:hypothetical protein